MYFLFSIITSFYDLEQYSSFNSMINFFLSFFFPPSARRYFIVHSTRASRTFSRSLEFAIKYFSIFFIFMLLFSLLVLLFLLYALAQHQNCKNIRRNKEKKQLERKCCYICPFCCLLCIFFLRVDTQAE